MLVVSVPYRNEILEFCMNPLYLAPIIGILVLIVIDQVARRLAYRKMNALYREHRYEDLLRFLTSWYPRWFFPAYNRQYAIFNTYAQMGNIKEADEQLTILFGLKQNDQQRCDLLLRAFQFYLKNGKNSKAANTLEKITAEASLAPAIEELKQLYEIMAQRSSAYIETMEQQLDGADLPTKHRLYYLLQLQYRNKGDKTNAERYRKLDESLGTEATA